MPISRSIIWTSVLWLLCWASSAAASEADAAAAEVLFQEGRQALAVEDYDKACLNFEESLRLQVAVGTVMNLATCEEKRGKFASSWERWQQALGLLEPGDRRREFAEQRAAAMAKSASRLTLSPHAEWAEKLVITSGGSRLGKASYGQALPVDAGERVITVESEGHRVRTYRVNLEPGEQRTLVVEPGPAEKAVETSEKDTENAGRTQKVFAFALAGVGVAGLGTAIVTAALLPGVQTTVDENCQAKQCNEDGLNAASTGQAMLTANTVGWIAAGVGLASAGILFLTLPSDDNPETQRVGVAFAPGGASLRLQGTF